MSHFRMSSHITEDCLDFLFVLGFASFGVERGITKDGVDSKLTPSSFSLCEH